MLRFYLGQITTFMKLNTRVFLHRILRQRCKRKAMSISQLWQTLKLEAHTPRAACRVKQRICC